MPPAPSGGDLARAEFVAGGKCHVLDSAKCSRSESKQVLYQVADKPAAGQEAKQYGARQDLIIGSTSTSDAMGQRDFPGPGRQR